MSEYIYLYRFPAGPPSSPQEREQRMQRWTVWMNDLEKKGHLLNRGKPLDGRGAVVKDKKGAFTDGPYAEAKDIQEAIQLSLGCPILEGGGLVEVRPVLKM